MTTSEVQPMPASASPDAAADTSDYEEVEETFYVVCDLHRQLNTRDLRANPSSQYALMGMDTDTPYLQYNGTTYCGEYEDSVGTQLIFYPRTQDADGLEESDQSKAELDYLTHTTKVLRFYPVTLKPNTSYEASAN
ncbi:hypothetical protein H4R35_004452 [Dimargaris xerosporica]|nr:hypothetical protein H4R35_004452 [Dimargaris xerosporica]